jgi:hypothetical protein
LIRRVVQLLAPLAVHGLQGLDRLDKVMILVLINRGLVELLVLLTVLLNALVVDLTASS